DVRAGLVSEVNTKTGLSVTATSGGGVNEIMLEADSGTSFSLTTAAVNAAGGTTNDNTIKTVTLDSASVVQSTIDGVVIASGTMKVGATVDGGKGKDELYGSSGSDILMGKDGADELTGQGGDDQLYGGNDNDQLAGGGGADQLYGEAGDDQLSGGKDDDAIYGGDGADQIDAGTGNDAIYGGDGADQIDAGTGNDVIEGGVGDDTIDGGEGHDVAAFYGDADDYTIDVANGQVTDSNFVGGDEGTDTLAGVEALQFGDGTELTLSTEDSPELQVNTYTDQTQYYSSIAGLKDGGYIVTWESYNHDDPNDYDIFAQRYGASGSAIGDEFQVNTYAPGNQHQPEVTGLENGGFFITWYDTSGSSGSRGGSGHDVFGQLYDASGSAVGGEILVNGGSTNVVHEEEYPDVTGLADGGFVVTWRADYQDGDSNNVYNVYGQRYGDDGAVKGDEFLVNTYTSGSQSEPSVAAHGDGFIVTWRDDSGNSGSRGG
ncbi:MAG: calcium-binding protein, partial [Pseudomonadota bacterium]|nr:calcium-binding protein [Pseudomonadota bacterium]